MSDITKIKVDGEPESSYQLYPRNEEFAKRAGGNGGSQSGVQSDWNQNDETASDYVKNRPFYSEVTETVLVEESTLAFTSLHPGIYYSAIQSTFNPVAGETYNVSWDGTTYECVCVTANGYPIIGNLSIIGAGADTGEPFIISPIADDSGIEIYTSDTSASHTISISGFVGEVVQIPDKYISNTFRDIIIAGNPLVWSDDEWANYYALFLSGKLLQITTDFGSVKRGYVLSMFYGATSRISFIDSSGNLYNLQNNSHAGELYWAPLLTTSGDLYLRYQQNASSPSDGTLEYATLGSNSSVLKFTTKNANENFTVERQVVLEGDKELILSSSTADSTKKFKITVDDSGALTATEVT